MCDLHKGSLFQSICMGPGGASSCVFIGNKECIADKVTFEDLVAFCRKIAAGQGSIRVCRQIKGMCDRLKCDWQTITSMIT